MDASPQFSHLEALKAIRRHESLSRIELAPLTGLSNATISAIVADLVQKGLVSESAGGGTQGARGRPRTQLRINPGGALIGGIFVHPDRNVNFQITNLVGERRLLVSRQLEAGLFDHAFVDEVASVFTELCREGGLIRGILAIGVGVPTIVDADRGLVHWIAPSRPPPTPFRDLLQKRLHIPVFVDSVANIIGRSEHWSSDGGDRSDMTVIEVGAGIGMAQYAGNAIRYGTHGFNAELGHMKIAAAAGRLCPCGGTGCLVTIASHFAILREVLGHEHMLDPTQTWLRKRFDEVVARANAGDAVLRAIFARAGAALGTAVANHINVSDPSKVVIISKSPNSIHLFEESFRAQLHADTLPAIRGHARLILRDADFEDNTDGTIALALDRLFGAA